jgi:sulfate adenylyltransferase
MLNPHGGKLINKIAKEEERKELLEKAKTLRKIVIANRYVSDCEMIANGGFSPLTGFMTKEDAEEVICLLYTSPSPRD